MAVESAGHSRKEQRHTGPKNETHEEEEGPVLVCLLVGERGREREGGERGVGRSACFSLSCLMCMLLQQGTNKNAQARQESFAVPAFYEPNSVLVLSHV